MVLLLLGAIAVRGQTNQPQLRPGDDPYHDFRQQAPLDSGSESDETIPDNLEEIAVGWFGPSDPSHQEHGDLWAAASLAIDQANRSDGWNGLPFRLVPRWSVNLWSTGASQVARMAYEDQVWAILGSVDGSATHLAEQVVAKARLPLVSPVATDESINLAGVPWMFSVVPGDHLWAPVLAKALAAENGAFALLTMTDHDSRLAADALTEALATLDRGPAMRLDLAPGAIPTEEQLERLDLHESAALLLIAGPEDGARLLCAVRASGFEKPIFATPQAARRRGLELAGSAADGVRVPALLASGDTAERKMFEQAFREATGSAPDWAALHTYDATRFLAEAIRLAGPSRARIREALLELSPWQGITGGR